jgi:hypothetical protein
MNSGTLVMPAGSPAARTLRMRIGAVIAAFALVFAMLVMVQDRADAAPVTRGAVAEQINISSIVCPTLLAIRAAFANTPFGGFVTPILNNLIVAFGCAPS